VFQTQFVTWATHALRKLPAARAHSITIEMLKWLEKKSAPRDDVRLGVDAFGLSFPNPVGAAAGFDKNIEVPGALHFIGFGFVEVGTLTPRAQPGNPHPRVFRLREDLAIINRYGFNNEGFAGAHKRLVQRRTKFGSKIVGVNIGANKDTEDRVADYVAGVTKFSDVASYFTINVSSPNTPGLRDLQEPEALSDLLARVIDARDAARIRRPLLLKIAPDLTLAQLDGIVRVARDKRIDGMIVSNTTISRPATLRSPLAKESGGLSGAPLFELSTHMLAQTYLRVEKQFPLIGVGGIDSPERAIAKIEAGATLIQLYTALIYCGPALIPRIKIGLLDTLARENTTLAALVGRNASDWTSNHIAA
jgi:dihydroorotate dehydrogenase